MFRFNPITQKLDLTGATGGGPDVGTLTGNAGGAVPASPSGNIFVLGAGGVVTTGNPGTNTLTISVSGEGMTWNTISASQTLAVNNGYICVSPGGALSLALPAVSAVGDIISVILDGATSFTITQGVGQQIRYGTRQTTSGATGTLASNFQGDSITMVCSVANTRWNVYNDQGTLTVS